MILMATLGYNYPVLKFGALLILEAYFRLLIRFIGIGIRIALVNKLPNRGIITKMGDTILDATSLYLLQEAAFHL